MVIKETRPTLWFKVLTRQGTPIDGSGETWSLPCGRDSGDKLDFTAQQAYYCNREVCSQLVGITGTWLVSDPKMLYPLNNTRRIFVAALLSVPVYKAPGTIWVHHLRLVREATNLDLKGFGIYRAFRQII